MNGLGHSKLKIVSLFLFIKSRIKFEIRIVDSESIPDSESY